MLRLFFFINICVALALVLGEGLNITNGAQDYFKAAQLQLQHSIEITEMKIASVDAIFASRLDVIHYEQHQMLHEIHQLNQSLTPLQSLSLVRKHCIQKYAPQLVTGSNARLELKICHDKAKLGIDTLTSEAKQSANSAKSYVIGQFWENVRACSKSHMKNDTALELCYIQNVELGTKTVRNFLKNAQDHLEKSLFESSVISHNAARCTYQVTSEVLKSMAATLKDINNCQKDFIEGNSLIVSHNEEHTLRIEHSEATNDENELKSENENMHYE